MKHVNATRNFYLQKAIPPPLLSVLELASLYGAFQGVFWISGPTALTKHKNGGVGRVWMTNFHSSNRHQIFFASY